MSDKKKLNLFLNTIIMKLLVRRLCFMCHFWQRNKIRKFKLLECRLAKLTFHQLKFAKV